MSKEDWKQLVKNTWHKVSLVVLKAFRGLVCEKKDGGWELSKGRTAFWVVFIHCMSVWNGGAKAAKELTEAATDVALSATAASTDAVAAVVEPGMLDSLLGTIYSMSSGTGVPEQEFYLLMGLLGYTALKTTKGGLTSLMSATRGK